MTVQDASTFINSIESQEAVQLSWGRLHWLVGAKNMPEAQQTFGVCVIYPGKRNPLHSHPNCEELLYVVSGECEHRLGDDIVRLSPGSVIRIPQGIPHWAKCIGEQPVTAIISFSSADRKTDSHEGDEVA